MADIREKPSMWLRVVLFLLGSVPWLMLLPGCSGGGGGSAPPPVTGCVTGMTPAPGLVVTDFGAVQGAQSGNAYSFLGIPYAAPPVGALR
jgi:hypothetical protein